MNKRWVKWTFIGLTAVTSVGTATAVAHYRHVGDRPPAIVFADQERTDAERHEAATHDPAYRAAHEGWAAVCPTLTPAQAVEWKHWCEIWG